jgi:phospholipase C
MKCFACVVSLTLLAGCGDDSAGPSGSGGSAGTSSSDGGSGGHAGTGGTGGIAGSGGSGGIGGSGGSGGVGGSGGSGGSGGTGGFQSPIEHVIVIVKENHTFDNYFGSFPGADGHASTGRPAVQLLQDLCHSHDCALADMAGGAMTGWTDSLATQQYTEQDIPNYWQYARHFVLGDRFFASQLGPSFPGHSFALSAQSAWAIGNPSQTTPWGCDDNTGTTIPVQNQTTCAIENQFPCWDFPTIPDLLPARGLTWKFYGSALPVEIWSLFDAVRHIRMGSEWSTNVVNYNQFDADADSGNLANVAYLINQDLASEHPPLNICQGESWTVDRLNHVMNNANLWAHTAIIMTYDDFGGWFDHVPPPIQYGCDPARPYGLGFRLPLIIVSPYAKPGFVFHGVSSHASIPKFIEHVFGLPSLNSMDPAAQDGDTTNDLFDAFDFNQAPNAPLPLQSRLCIGQR